MNQGHQKRDIDAEFFKWVATLKPVPPPVHVLSAHARLTEAERLLEAKCLLEATQQEIKPKPSQRKRREPAPEINPLGLRTRREAAARLRCSVKTVDAHVDAGALRYVLIGHGIARQRKMFTDADLDQFLANQTRTTAPCPSISTPALNSTNTSSKSVVVAFTDRRKRPRGGKR
jgi:hypothetical protein